MAQDGHVFLDRGWWYLRYRTNVVIDGKITRKQKAVKLARCSDEYRCESDLEDLREERLAEVRAADKCPKSSEDFFTYVEDTYFAFARQALKPSTVAGYLNYWKRYISPRTKRRALRDFRTADISMLLKDVSRSHKLNTHTVTKIRSVLCAIFSYAISEGHYPARSISENPARGARIPVESTSQPTETITATRDQVQALLKALEGLATERAAVALIALSGVRPNEARGLRWEDWDRTKQHIAIRRGVWHTIVGTTKTAKSQGFVTVTDELRTILLDLWREQKSPISGYVLAASEGKNPVILDNLAKRSIRDALNRCGACHEPESAEHDGHEFQRDESLPSWPGWYGLRRFHATEVCAKADSETAANALRNTKDIARKHYIKPDGVLPKTRQAVNDAVSGLIQ